MVRSSFDYRSTWIARPARRIELACSGETCEDVRWTCADSEEPMSAAPTA